MITAGFVFHQHSYNHCTRSVFDKGKMVKHYYKSHVGDHYATTVLTCCLFFFPDLHAPQWEEQPGEAAVRAAAGGGLPVHWAGGTTRLYTGAAETAGPPEAAEGGSRDATCTAAHGGPERVQHERRRMTITQHTPRHPWLFSSLVCLQFRSVTHVILRPAVQSDDIWMKM